MPHGPTTRSSLLVRLRGARDEEAWGHFVRVYAPLVYGFARRRGSQDSNSGDVTQEVLRAVLRRAGELGQVHHRGSLRSWPLTLAHHKVFDLNKRRERPGQAGGGSEVQAHLDEQPAREEHSTAPGSGSTANGSSPGRRPRSAPGARRRPGRPSG